MASEDQAPRRPPSEQVHPFARATTVKQFHVITGLRANGTRKRRPGTVEVFANGVKQMQMVVVPNETTSIDFQPPIRATGVITLTTTGATAHLIFDEGTFPFEAP